MSNVALFFAAPVAAITVAAVARCIWQGRAGGLGVPVAWRD